MDARDEVELAARESYGRLLAWLTSRCGSIALAEDALGDALAAALTSWTRDGVPKNTEAWLLTVARRRLVDDARRETTRQNAQDNLRLDTQLRLHREASEASDVAYRDRLPDRRLELMFMCAHPDIPEAMRTPLMLQTVLGLTAEEIASSFLVAPATIGQRLVRVKRRIVEQSIPFELPEHDALPGRLKHVLDAVYAAYGTGWNAAPDLGSGRSGLAGEALWLAGLLVRLAPQAADAKGLYALLCLCESRQPARRGPNGEFVPLEEQDPSLWDHELILEGERALWLASKQKQMGAYLNEAAIHSIHAHRARTGTIDWEGIHRAYLVLVGHFPSLGARIGYAASFGRVGKPSEGIAVLDELDEAAVRRHQPYWAVRAWLLRRAGRSGESTEAYDRAIGLSEDSAVRAWLTARRDEGR